MTYWGLLLRMKKTGEEYKGNTLYQSEEEANRVGRSYVSTLCPWLEILGTHNTEGTENRDTTQAAEG